MLRGRREAGCGQPQHIQPDLTIMLEESRSFVGNRAQATADSNKS